MLYAKIGTRSEGLKPNDMVDGSWGTKNQIPQKYWDKAENPEWVPEEPDSPEFLYTNTFEKADAMPSGKYQFDGTTWVDLVTPQEVKDAKLVDDLAEVDTWVNQERAKNFLYDTHMYYPDADSLNALITTIPYKPEDFTMNWKTADLEADGISNIYVLLDKAGIIALGMTLELRQGTLWAQGDAQKIALKEAYNNS